MSGTGHMTARMGGLAGRCWLALLIVVLCAGVARADSVVWTVSDIAGFGQALAVQPNGQRIYYGCPGYDRHTSGDNQGVVAVGTPGGGFSGLIEYPLAPAFGSAFGGLITASDSYVAIWGEGRVFVFNAGGGSTIAQYGGVNGFGYELESTSSTLYVGYPYYTGTHANQGRVYVYPWGPTTSPLVIDHPEPAAGDYFGENIAIGESLIAVSTFWRASARGKVYLFDLQTLAFVRAIDNPTTNADHFGNEMAFAGANLVVTASGDPLSFPPYPTVGYLFDSATGDLITTLPKTRNTNFSGSGGLAADGSHIIAGDIYESGPSGEVWAGAYNVYDAQTGQLLWTTLNPAAAPSGYRWGYRIVFLGSDALVNEQTAGSLDDAVFRMQLTTPSAVYDWRFFQ